MMYAPIHAPYAWHKHHQLTLGGWHVCCTNRNQEKGSTKKNNAPSKRERYKSAVLRCAVCAPGLAKSTLALNAIPCNTLGVACCFLYRRTRHYSYESYVAPELVLRHSWSESALPDFQSRSCTPRFTCFDGSMVVNAGGGQANSKFIWFVAAITTLFALSAFHHGSGGGDWVSDHSGRESVRRLAFGDHNMADEDDEEDADEGEIGNDEGIFPNVISAVRKNSDAGWGAAAQAHAEPIWQAANAHGDVFTPWKTVAAAHEFAPGVSVFVTCGYNKGRSGHELKDVATPFILGVMYGWEPCSSWWWTSKPVKMFNPAYRLRDCETYSRKDEIKKGKDSLEIRLGAEKIVQIRHTMTSYDGMEFEQVEELAAKVKRAAAEATPGTAIRVLLLKSTRVHMHQVYNWRLAGKIPHAVFEPVRRTLQARFYYHMSRTQYMVANVEKVPELSYLTGPPECKGNDNATAHCVYFSPSGAEAASVYSKTPAEHQPDSTTVVAAHFRRGDVAHMSKMEYSSKDFAQRLANQMHTLLDPCDGDLVLTIHTERRGADDLKKSPGIMNITKLYHTESWEHDMSAFINADILVVTNSSMSTWASIFATGLTIMPSGEYVKHFGFNPPPANLIPFTDTLELPKGWLENRGCIAKGTADGKRQSENFHFGVWQ